MSKTADVVLEVGDQVGECPTWDAATGLLWWTDINSHRLHRYHPATGAHTIIDTPARVGSFALTRSNDILIAMEHGLGMFEPASGRYTPIAVPEAGLLTNRFNDGRCDRRGRFFAGSMDTAEPRRPSGILWRLDSDKAVTRIADDVMIANGLAWSPDDKIMYWADSIARRTWAFDYDITTGSARNRRLWIEGGDPAIGVPDGSAVDSEGGYWSARYGGGRVIRYTPDGRIDREIHLPVNNVTMCAFAGPDLRTLYITTARQNMTAEQLARAPLAGALFAADPGVGGLPEPKFAG